VSNLRAIMALLLILKFVRTSSLIPQMQFQWNFTGLICSSSPCAYCRGFSVEWFLAELWPFDKKVFFSVCCQIHKSLSGLLLINYWCNFIQTLQEWSVPSLVVHIVSIFRLNDFCQSYGPLIIFIFKVCPDYFSYTTKQFQWNFTGLICSSSPCAYCTGFLVEWFLAELWPFDKKVFFSVCCQINKSFSGLLLINYWCNFIQTLQEW
jgi:hypothetical protein